MRQVYFRGRSIFNVLLLLLRHTTKSSRCQYETKPNTIVARPLHFQLHTTLKGSSMTSDLTFKRNLWNRIEWLGDTYRAVESFWSILLKTNREIYDMQWRQSRRLESHS